jgi:hypothetical protein
MFGITLKQPIVLQTAELFLGSFAACALKCGTFFDYDEF